MIQLPQQHPAGTRGNRPEIHLLTPGQRYLPIMGLQPFSLPRAGSPSGRHDGCFMACPHSQPRSSGNAATMCSRTCLASLMFAPSVWITMSIVTRLFRNAPAVIVGYQCHGLVANFRLHDTILPRPGWSHGPMNVEPELPVRVRFRPCREGRSPSIWTYACPFQKAGLSSSPI